MLTVHLSSPEKQWILKHNDNFKEQFVQFKELVNLQLELTEKKITLKK